ncbi:MAG: acyltransferase family protein [Myxococcota bacterium]
MSAPRERFAEIDALKVAGIVTIPLIHALRAPWDPAVAPLEVWIGHATRFAVPAFLFASGFLYATRERVAGSTLRGRLRRILLPYLLASLLAQAFRAATGHEGGVGDWWLDLLIGASFGPYYYVFVIVCLVLATPLFAALPARLLPALLLLLAGLQWVTDAGALGWVDMRVHIRNPLLWWAYFLLGWCVRLHWPGVRRFADAHRPLLLLTFGTAVVLLTAASGLEGSAPRLAVRTAAWLDVYAILGLVFVAAGRMQRVPGWLRFTSDATYALYLFHLFFLLPARWLWPQPDGAVTAAGILLPWAVALAGPLLLVLAAQTLLGARSRAWIGA